MRDHARSCLESVSSAGQVPSPGATLYPDLSLTLLRRSPNECAHRSSREEGFRANRIFSGVTYARSATVCHDAETSEATWICTGVL
jgi:hypothetical protein